MSERDWIAELLDNLWRDADVGKPTVLELKLRPLLEAGQEMRDWRPAAEDGVRYDLAKQKALKP